MYNERVLTTDAARYSPDVTHVRQDKRLACIRIEQTN